jgi:hypothetical protein
VSLRFDRERLCYELFHAGFKEADLQRVISPVAPRIYPLLPPQNNSLLYSLRSSVSTSGSN